MRLRIRELRQRRGMLLRELAARIEISLPSLAAKERGEHRIHLDELLRISAALDVPLWDLVDLDSPPDPPPPSRSTCNGTQPPRGHTTRRNGQRKEP